MVKLRVSVTELAQLVCRTGDLDFGGAIGPTARQGQKAHQQWQANTADDTEVSIKVRLKVAGVEVTLQGRIDCLNRTAQHVTEIKSTLVPAAQLSDAQKQLHRAQCRLYAYCLLHEQTTVPTLAEKSGERAWRLDVLYINLRDDSKPRVDAEQLSYIDILSFGNDVVDRYVAWMKKVHSQHQLSKAAAKGLAFPFTHFRAGQRSLAASVFRAARDSQIHLCEAPTGIGKTISTLFPAVKAFGEKEAQQIVYLTAKASGVAAVYTAIDNMEKSGLAINAISLRSKQLTCFCSNGGCERDEQGRCPVSVGFFDRLPAAREELLMMGVITPAALDDVAWKHQLCPFELALQLLPWMTIVVCDYNYVFDPLVRLPCFSEPQKRSLLLVDESHNLPDRSRNMFSAQLDRYQCWRVSECLRVDHKALLPRMDAVDKALLKQARGLPDGETVMERSPDGLRASVSSAVEALMEALSAVPVLPIEAVDWFKALCRYAAIDDLYGGAHRTIISVTKVQGKRNVSIQLTCLDASEELAKLYKYYRSVCFFSATLRPENFYRKVLGVADDAAFARLNSPFSQEQSLCLSVPTIGTRYRQRQGSLDALVELVHDVYEAKAGSYLVFLPSFAYLDSLWAAYVARYPDCEVWRQEPGHSRAERQAQLDRLQNGGPHLGFVILGGVFGEGVDYVGDQLIGAIVVGVGLPGLSTEQDLMATHFREQGFDGFDFTSRIPGLIRVLQTAGRVIRSESDRGVIVLVDDRFQQAFYRQNLPEHVQPTVCKDRSGWNRQLAAFWHS